MHTVNHATVQKLVRAFAQRAGRERWHHTALAVVRRDGEPCAIYPEEVAPETIAALAVARREIAGQVDPHRPADEFDAIKPHDACAVVMRSGRHAIGAVSVSGLGERNEEIARFCEDIFFGRKPRPRPREVE